MTLDLSNEEIRVFLHEYLASKGFNVTDVNLFSDDGSEAEVTATCEITATGL